MKPLRVLAGCVCIAIGCGLVVLLAVGAFDPITSAAEGLSSTPAMVALQPSVSFGIAIVAVGAWLISTGRSKQ